MEKTTSGIKAADLAKVVTEYTKRKPGYFPDLAFLSTLGGTFFGSVAPSFTFPMIGVEGIAEKVKTDIQNGLSPGTVTENRTHFGSNAKEKVKRRSVWQIFGSVMHDRILQILLVGGIVLLIINMSTETDELETGTVFFRMRKTPNKKIYSMGGWSCNFGFGTHSGRRNYGKRL